VAWTAAKQKVAVGHTQLLQRLSLDAGMNGLRDYCAKIDAVQRCQW